MLKSKKTIYLASDHCGFKLKNELIIFLTKLKYNCVDVGNTKHDPIDDYADYAILAASKVAKANSIGILICGSGIGMCIAANKVKGARAFNAASITLSRLAKAHNNTNILCLGAKNINSALAKRMIRVWLNTSFSNLKKHKRRVIKISKYEKNNTGNSK